MRLFRLQLGPFLLAQLCFDLANTSAIGHLVALAHYRLLLEQLAIMLDDSLGAELIDMLLVNVQHLSTVGLRVDVLGWISGVAQLVDAFRQSCLWLYLHGDPARFSIFPRTRYNLVDLTAAIQHYDFHAAFGLAVMCAHYLFDPDFCNVAAGWEKGIVEKNVQDSRRRIWLDAQDCQFHSFEELNAWLGQRCRALWNELTHPQYSGLSVAEVLELERAELMPVPAPFDGYVERPARVSSTCLVSVGRNRYSVPCEYAGKWVSSRLYPTRIEVVADDALIASHVRLLDRDQVSYDWQHYLPLIERKPGALRNGAPFADLPAPLRQLKHGLGRHAGGDRIMAQVLAAVPVAGLDAVLVAVELVLESGSLSAEHILNVVARLAATEPPPSVETHLSLKEAPVANTARYDRLRGQTEEIGHA